MIITCVIFLDICDDASIPSLSKILRLFSAIGDHVAFIHAEEKLISLFAFFAYSLLIYSAIGDLQVFHVHT